MLSLSLGTGFIGRHSMIRGWGMEGAEQGGYEGGGEGGGGEGRRVGRVSEKEGRGAHLETAAPQSFAL